MKSLHELTSLSSRMRARLEEIMRGDRIPIRRELDAIDRLLQSAGSQERILKRLGALDRRIERAAGKKASREAHRPTVTYPTALPITAKKNDIIAAIRRHRVVVVTGETGSGKTTQIPKMCIEADRGIDGSIGCTQPRRIAAVSVAERIAEEFSEPLGRSVGYKIRFEERAGPTNYIKIMTDGILLMETQHDPLLNAYDTIIIDEAHERSINIDFTLGILKGLLKKRRDLRLVITSATIHPETFSRAFGNAPIIEVSGRMYPVEVWYRPIDDRMDGNGGGGYVDAAVAAVHELETARASGDILIFMPTEQDIRETCAMLKAGKSTHAMILPLFARLPQADQRRVFQPAKARKIIVATNVAETSLTIPGIRYVIDTGLARIADYNPSTRTKRLPVTPISKSSAIQRQGRCGRVEDGVCIRLYSEDDYKERLPFTPPEILRSNLAEVILRMISLGMGDVGAFPFIDPPGTKAVTDGFTILNELGALTRTHTRVALTETGRKLALLPLDPRMARIILEAEKEGCVPEAVIIASALSVQDPRERPPEREKEADAAHAPFVHVRSDFMTYLNMWHALRRACGGSITQGRMRKFCQEHFLSYRRMKEWIDIHEEITDILKEAEPSASGQATHLKGEALYTAVHKAVLCGYLANTAVRKEQNLYRTAKGKEVMIFPGSATFNRGGDWIVSAEIVETTRTFARTVGAIDGSWIEEAGGALCRHTYTDPRWDAARQMVTAAEQVSLFKLVIVPGRSAPYGPVAPEESSRIFIREGLVRGALNTPFPFLERNRRLIETVTAMEDKLRKKTVLADEDALVSWYRSRLGMVYDVDTLSREIERRGSDEFLTMTEEDVMRYTPGEELTPYPDAITLGGKTLDVFYRFLPGSDHDGVTVRVPVQHVAKVPLEAADRKIPGLFREQVTALIKGLPKEYRRKLVPLPRTVDTIVEEMVMNEEALLPALARFIHRRFDVAIPATAWPHDSLPAHLKIRFALVDAAGREMRAGRNAEELRTSQEAGPSPALLRAVRSRWEKTQLTGWNFGDIPDTVSIPAAEGTDIILYPALAPAGEFVNLCLLENGEEARRSHREGVMHLYSIVFKKDLATLRKYLTIPDDAKAAARHFGGARTVEALLYMKTMKMLFDREIRTKKDFHDHGSAGRTAILPTGQQCLREILPVLFAYDTAHRSLSSMASSNRQNPAIVRYIEERKADLARIVPTDFPVRCDADEFAVLPRYLDAVVRRAGRGTAHLEKDRQKAVKAEVYQGRFETLIRTLPAFTSPEKKEAITRLRWMIEEYKISLFTPEMKTLYPVSPKRLSDALNEIEHMI